MNPYILEDAAVYVNAYRDGCVKHGIACNPAVLRGHVSRMFGPVYAAILVN